MTIAFWISYGALWLLVIGLIVAVIAMYYTVGKQHLNSREGRAEQGPPVGSPLQSLVVRDLNREEVTVPKSGRPSLLLFAATQCVPCENMRSYVATSVRDDVNTVVICAGDWEEVVEWAAPLRPSEATVIADPKQAIGARYQIGLTPYGLALSPDGKVLAKGIMSDPPAIDWLLDHASRSILQQQAVDGAGNSEAVL